MSKEEEVPPPPSLNELVRVRHGLPPRTLMDELHIQFEARLRANGGKLVPLTAAELAEPVPPPPDIADLIRQTRKKEKK